MGRPPRPGIVTAEQAMDAIHRCDGATVARYFRQGRPDPRVAAAVADLFDPDLPAGFLNQYRVAFMRRITGRPDQRIRDKVIAIQVEKLFQRASQLGCIKKTGLRKRVIGRIADEWEMTDTAVNEAIRKAKLPNK
jgi:hypothetical protein